MATGKRGGQVWGSFVPGISGDEIMKAIIVLLVLGALALGGVYMFGGYSNFDPEKQAQELRAAIKPGMTFKQVMKVAQGKNPKYSAINRFEHKEGKEVVYEYREGTPVAFDEKKVTQRLRDNEVPHGFVLSYNFSEKTAFAVEFDGDGKVEDIRDLRTMADLLQTR
jgi:hypothetical protein